MFFPKLTALLLGLGAVCGIQAGPVPEADAMPFQDIDITQQLSELETRALPPCVEKLPLLPSPYPTWTTAERQAQLQVDIDSPKPWGWRPSVCTTALWNCVYVQKGVSSGVGGFGRSAVFPLDDGTTVEVYAYWQSTVQWKSAHGSINSYMAHGVDYVCVRGIASVLFLGTGEILTGDGIPSDKSVENCTCHYPVDDEKILYPQ